MGGGVDGLRQCGELIRPLCRPGFPPIQGLESAEPSQQSLVGVLETAMKLANHDEGSDEEEEETPKKVQGVRAEVGDNERKRSGQPHAISLPPCCSLSLSPLVYRKGQHRIASLYRAAAEQRWKQDHKYVQCWR